MSFKKEKNISPTNQDVWVAQKAAEIVAEDEKLQFTHVVKTQTRSTDILKLFGILLRALFLYPRASLKALLYFFNIKVLNDKTSDYAPQSPSLKSLFELLQTETPIPKTGGLILMNEEIWDDYLILAHLLAKGFQKQLQERDEVVTKIRWGLAHGLYNAIVHGDPNYPIYIRWKILSDEFQLQIVNAKNEERMKHHDVSSNGIPISGIGGSLVIMWLLFDYFNLSEVVNVKDEWEVRLTLIQRRNQGRSSLRHKAGVRVANARDYIQLERIMRQYH